MSSLLGRGWLRLAAFGLLVPTFVGAEALCNGRSGEFQKTHWGQSVDEVRRLYPAATQHQDGSNVHLTDYSFGSIDGLKVSAVVFLFVSDRLSAVMVSLSVKQTKDAEIEVAAEVFNALRSKYGLATKVGTADAVAEWDCTSTVVKLASGALKDEDGKKKKTVLVGYRWNALPTPIEDEGF